MRYYGRIWSRASGQVKKRDSPILFQPHTSVMIYIFLHDLTGNCVLLLLGTENVHMVRGAWIFDTCLPCLNVESQRYLFMIMPFLGYKNSPIPRLMSVAISLND